MRHVEPRRRVADRGTFALTFDDGPDPVFTPQVLELLAEHRSTATFFMVGQSARSHPQLVRRVLAEGHGIGSHTWSHPDLLELSLPAQLWECARGRRAVERAAGAAVRAYRPPRGHWDGRAAAAAASLRLRPWLWTIDPADWRGEIRPEAILDAVGPLSGGDVVLLHDGIHLPESTAARDRSATVAALGPILEMASDRGLRSVRLEAV